MRKKLIIGFLISLFSVCVLALPAKAAPAPYFKLVASEGQGAGSDEFYVGRCFRVNIYLNTSVYNTNGADVEINYDNNAVQVVQSDCTTAATTIYSDGLYNVYPSQGNEVSNSKILLSAYNNPGVSSKTSYGLYGHFFLRILTTSNPFNLNFEYTQGLTTDTNLAQTSGDGSDILLSVENLALKLLEDTDDPAVNSKSPAVDATGVSVDSNVSFVPYDAMAGVNSSGVSARMKKDGGTYYSQTASLGSVQSTNANRYYQYTASISPNSNIKTSNGYYEYNTKYYVEATVNDLASTPHQTVSTWSFTTESDTDAPYITNRDPSSNATGVATSTNVVFRLKDYKSNGGVIPGLGVDTDSISISLTSSSTGQIAYTCGSNGVTCDISGGAYNVLITINPSTNFVENELVTVRVEASDLATAANEMGQVVYSFTTADTVPPVITNFSPTVYSNGNSTSTNISFHLTDGGAGVAIETLSIYVDDTAYTAVSPELSITGDASDYTIVIDPATNFTNNRPVVVRIAVRDQAPSLNWVSPNPTLYSFVVGYTSEECADCPTCQNCETCQTCAPCSGGGGILFIEKKCPPCPEAPKCEEKIKYVTVTTTVEKESGKVICPKIPVSAQSTGGSTTSSGGVFKEMVSELKDLFSGGGTGLTVAGIKSVNLNKINNRSVPGADKFIRFPDTEEDLVLVGEAEAGGVNSIPLMIYPVGKDGSPIILQAKLEGDGGFSVKIKNIFASGEYRVTSLINSNDTEKEIEIGRFAIEKTIFVPLQTEEEYRQRESRFDWGSIAVFVTIVMVSISVLFTSRTMASSFGFISTFLLAIFGIVMVTTYSRGTPVNVETLQTTRNIEEAQLQTQAYETLLQEQRVEMPSFQGALIDPVQNRPLANSIVSVGDQVVETDSDGKFSLVGVKSTDKMIISVPEAESPIMLEVGKESEKTLYISPSLTQVLVKVQSDYSQRKFKTVYPYAADSLKKYESEQQFVVNRNYSLLERLKKYNILANNFDPRVTMLKQWASDKLNKTFANVAQVNFVYSGYNDKDGVVRLEEPWYFTYEGGEWRFIE